MPLSHGFVVVLHVSKNIFHLSFAVLLLLVSCILCVVIRLLCPNDGQFPPLHSSSLVTMCPPRTRAFARASVLSHTLRWR